MGEETGERGEGKVKLGKERGGSLARSEGVGKRREGRNGGLRIEERWEEEIREGGKREEVRY